MLILSEIKNYAAGRVLDMGTGSGILAIEASRYAEKVLAADIERDALSAARKNAEKEGCTNIGFVQSDLFSKIKGRFDLIIFNPPYLPGCSDKTVDGGKHGYELTGRFLKDVPRFLKDNGNVLLVFSSLTKKAKVEELIKGYGLDFEKIKEQRIFFETIYLYQVFKSELLVKLGKLHVRNLELAAKGHRGIVYKGRLNKRIVAVKVERKNSGALNRINNEAEWLKILNRHGIGPGLIKHDDNFIITEFIEGRLIIDFLKKADKPEITSTISNLFRQLYQMDRIGVDKEEMHHPVKHIIVTGSKAVLIDFERCRRTERPKNVTQFCQFLSSERVHEILNLKSIDYSAETLRKLAKGYKFDMSRNILDQIIALFKG